jgi:hypothetical protein
MPKSQNGALKKPMMWIRMYDEDSYLVNVPVVPLRAGKRNTRKPRHRRHFLRLFLLFHFKKEKQQKRRMRAGVLRASLIRAQVCSESGTSGTSVIPLIFIAFSCSANRLKAAHNSL